MVAASALDLIGSTPLVALDRIHPGPGRILAKVDFLLPGGSMKDRSARSIIVAARADGRVRSGMPVIEMTGGNMGAGLAVVCATLGLDFVLTMSAGNSPARARMLEAMGAEVVLVPQVDGKPGYGHGCGHRRCQRGRASDRQHTRRISGRPVQCARAYSRARERNGGRNPQAVPRADRRLGRRGRHRRDFHGRFASAEACTP